jgi:hypothetical protein
VISKDEMRLALHYLRCATDAQFLSLLYDSGRDDVTGVRSPEALKNYAIERGFRPEALVKIGNVTLQVTSWPWIEGSRAMIMARTVPGDPRSNRPVDFNKLDTLETEVVGSQPLDA